MSDLRTEISEQTADVLHPAAPDNTDLHIQADDVSGRPSPAAEAAHAKDRLTETPDAACSVESYEQLSLPESLKGCEENFAAFKQLAADLKIPSQTAEKLVDWEAAATQAAAQQAQQQRAEILQKWQARTKELFGAGYRQEIARAQQAAQRFGGAELQALLDETGLGSHPVMVQAFHRIYQQISEDQSIGGRVRNSTDKTFTEALYGKAD